MKPMLATSVKLEQVQYPVYASPKLDGIRALMTPEGLVSRSLKPIRNLHTQLSLTGARGLMLDGELIVGPSNAPDVYTQTSSGIMSVQGTPDFTYYVFDLYGHDGGYQERLETLRKLAQGYRNMAVLPQLWLGDEEALLRYEMSVLSQGYEGVMLRRPNSLYKHGRSTVREGYLLKRKPLADAEGVIVDCEFLQRNFNVATTNELGYTQRSSAQEGKMTDTSRLGTLTVRVLNGPFEGVEVKIGTGFTDLERQALAIRLHSQKNDLLGKIVNFTYQAEGAKDRPRFPSFKGFRSQEDMS